MAPIVKILPFYSKDSQHALEIFRDFNFLGQNQLILTMDITSLYTVIPNDEGLRALKHFFDHHTVKEPSSKTRRDDSDFSEKSEAVSVFDKRGYPVSVIQAGHHCVQLIDRQSALQTDERENINRIPFILTFHPHNHALKSIVQNDSETGTIFPQLHLFHSNATKT